MYFTNYIYIQWAQIVIYFSRRYFRHNWIRYLDLLHVPVISMLNFVTYWLYIFVQYNEFKYLLCFMCFKSLNTLNLTGHKLLHRIEKYKTLRLEYQMYFVNVNCLQF